MKRESRVTMTIIGTVAAVAAVVGWLLTPEPTHMNAEHYADESELRRYDFSGDAETLKLDGPLNEISGVAFDDEGRLFGHNDEKGDVFQIDPKTGDVLKRFSLEGKVREDFEGIALVGETFFLVASDGTLYAFEDASDGEETPYRKIKTPLKKDNDVEGLCYDLATESLLVACKEDPGDKDYDDFRAVYSFSLADEEMDEKPRFLIERKRLEKFSEHDEFKPSAIERHPIGGTFFVLGGKGRVVVELSPEGDVLAAATLDPKRHRQPEGLAFTLDGTMYVADESAGAGGRITVYPYRSK